MLPTETAHYAVNVLRLREQSPLILFNGQGGEFAAHICAIRKKVVQVEITAFIDKTVESPLFLTLAQAVSKPDHMDMTLQKSVELGVRQIVPLLTERSAVLSTQRQDKRWQHWYRVVYNACEQCGRNQLPALLPLQTLSDWLATSQKGLRLVLVPGADPCWRTLDAPTDITLLIGAEGGLSGAEVKQAFNAGYQSLSLGPRILRTETAAISSIAVCQALWGDG